MIALLLVIFRTVVIVLYILVCSLIQQHDSTILVIFRTVVLAMDRFAGHIWNISHWSLFVILVTGFFGLAIFLKDVLQRIYRFYMERLYTGILEHLSFGSAYRFYSPAIF